jgi:hypothetical protein
MDRLGTENIRIGRRRCRIGNDLRKIGNGDEYVLPIDKKRIVCINGIQNTQTSTSSLMQDGNTV